MSSRVDEYCYKGEKPVKLVKWKVRIGSRVSHGTVLLLFQNDEKENEKSMPKSHRKLKCNTVGTVQKLVAEEGSIICPGTLLMYLESSCPHSIVMKDLCAECGADLRQLDSDKLAKVTASTSVSMVHSIPELRVSYEQAQQLGQADEERLLKNRKLVLLVDLDQTLIHTTNDSVPPNLKDVTHFQLYGPHSPWYHTRLRPGTMQFLEKISQLYELHICTFGARPYAHKIASILDPQGRLFSHRILSRDECFNPTSKTGNLKALFPCGDSMVCIIDDREDVWNYAPNLIPVKPYNFFHNTGDINAPPSIPIGIDSDKQFTSAPNDAKEAITEAEDHSSKPAAVSVNNDESVDHQKSDENDKLETTDSNENDFTVVTADATNNQESKDNAQFLQSEQDNTEHNGEQAEKNAEEITSVVAMETSTNDMQVKDCLDDLCTSVSNSVSVVNDSETKFTEHDLNDKQEDLSNDGSENITTLAPNPENCAEPDIKPTEDQESSVEKDASDSAGSAEESFNLDASDDDDYLIYLEEILTTIHKAYFDIYDQMKSQGGSEIPDLKNIIPYVRRKVLKGVNIVFSGVIPTNMPPEKSKLWNLAKSLGANVTSDIVLPYENGPATTHIIAAKLGTAKVNRAKKIKGINIVSPEWLWACAERWEHVDELVFPLNKEIDPKAMSFLCRASDSRNVGGQLVSHLLAERAAKGRESMQDACPVYDPVTGKRIRTGEKSKAQRSHGTANSDYSNSTVCLESSPEDKEEESQKLQDSYNPLLAFSVEDLAEMDKEVDDACSGDSEEDDGEQQDADETNEDDDAKYNDEFRAKSLSSTKRLKHSDTESSSAESLTGGECPLGWKRRKKLRTDDALNDDDEKRDEFGGIIESDGEENPCPIFPRRELPYDSDRSEEEKSSTDDFNESVGSVDEEMAAAVEREFLGS